MKKTNVSGQFTEMYEMSKDWKYGAIILFKFSNVFHVRMPMVQINKELKVQLGTSIQTLFESTDCAIYVYFKP